MSAPANKAVPIAVATRVVHHPAGDYHVIKDLGMGGMAVVWLARRQTATGGAPTGLFAIKSLLPAFREDPDVRMLFEYEAKTCRQLRHPNIVRTYELIREGDELHLVMELVEGQNLSQLMQKTRATDRALPVDSALYIIAEIAAALSYAHLKKDDETGATLQIFHRDVSPRNIMVTVTGGVKLLDFGIAKAKDRAKITQTGTFRGTRGYASPEQVSGEEIDCRSDIYSLGVVLQELIDVTEIGAIAARRPPGEPGSGATLEQPTLSGNAQDVLRLCQKCTAPDREQRFGTAMELAEEIRKMLGSRGDAARDHLKQIMQSIFSPAPIRIVPAPSSAATPDSEGEPDEVTVQGDEPTMIRLSGVNRAGHRRDKGRGLRVGRWLIVLTGLVIALGGGLTYFIEGELRWSPELPGKIGQLLMNPDQIARMLENRGESNAKPARHPTGGSSWLPDQK